MACEQQEQCDAPECESPPAAPGECGQQCEKRDEAREEEQAVHPAVDPVEDQHPRRRGQERCDGTSVSTGETLAEEREQGDARHREDERDHPQSAQTAAEMHDEPGEHEVQRRAATLRDHHVQQVAQGVAADEQRQRLVLVRRPAVEEPGEHPGEGERHSCRPDPEEIRLPDAHACARQGDRAGGDLVHRDGFSELAKPIPLLASLVPVPTYEYKCPNGHVFEVFKRIADPPPEKCPVCEASPVETVLYPVPVHFRGSGFYSTDYGRGGRKKEKE